MSTTYYDLVQHACNYLGGVNDATNFRKAKGAVSLAYEEMAGLRIWSYFNTRGRIYVNAPYSTGTVTVDVTGGAYERMVTLASGTWPTWAIQGSLLISNVVYQVATRESSTIITLTRSSVPASDIAAGTSYEIFQNTYPLPTDFVEMGRLYVASYNGRYVEYVSPQEYLNYQSHLSTCSPANYFTIMGSPDYQGAMTLCLPRPSQADVYDYVYKRRPRRMKIYQEKAGTVTTSGTTVTGTSTAFTSAMRGATIRFGDSTYAPGSLIEEHPYADERTVVAYTSATSLTLDTALTDEVSSVKYTITDPADVEEGAMTTLLYRMVEEQMRIATRTEPKKEDVRALDMAKQKAFAEDSRIVSARSEGGRPYYVFDLRE